MRGLVRFVLPILGLGIACSPRTAPWPSAVAPGAQGPMVLVTFESLRADFVGGLGGEAGNTPALDDLIPEARDSGGWAGRAVAPSSWTAPVLASLMTGLDSWQHEVLHAGRNQLGPDVPTLAERLQEVGWTRRAFAPGRRVGPKSGLGRGFDVLSPPREDGRRLAADYLRSLPAGREFVWIHLSRPGAVFERHRTAGLSAERLHAEYRDYVRWLDGQLGLLIAALRESGRWNEALLAVVACQGQDLGDPGPRGVGGHLERSLIEVPMVVKLPEPFGRRLAIPAESRVATLRLAATLLEAAGATPPPALAPSLFDAETPPILSELYVVGGSNHFSLVEGDLQLLRRVPLANPGRPVGEILRRFQEVLPLTGRGGVEQRLVHWSPGSGTEPAVDPAAEGRLSTALDEAWLAFVERERAPSAERWAVRTR